MRTNRLLPGKIADRHEDEETMAGYAQTRTTSADGRWVYTLYQKPSGAPFVHALDNPPAPGPKLRALLRRAPAWGRDA